MMKFFGKSKFVVIFLSILFSSKSLVANDKIKLQLDHKGRAVFKKVGPMVFQIITALNEDSPKRNYGSGFVVDKSGLLLTNYHVISTALQDRERKYSVFVVMKNKITKARVLAIDVVNDVALIKVNQTFSNKLKLSRRSLQQGETIYSVGMPEDLNISIIRGNYNGLVEPIFQKIHMSSPLNSGMSGGPTVNSRSEVIGLNVSILRKSQNISFGVPIKHGKKLLDDYKKMPDLADIKHVDSEINKQLLNAQEEIIENAFAGTGKKEVGNWRYALPADDLKCWGKTNNVSRKLYDIKMQSCTLPAASYLKSHKYSSGYRVTVKAIENNKLNSVQFYNNLSEIHNANSKLPPVYRGENKSKLFNTPYHCEHETIENDHKISFRIDYCIRAYIFYPDIYDVFLKASSISDLRDAIHLRLSLAGFSPKNIERFIRHQLNSVEFSKK